MKKNSKAKAEILANKLMSNAEIRLWKDRGITSMKNARLWEWDYYVNKRTDFQLFDTRTNKGWIHQGDNLTINEHENFNK